MFPKCFRRKIGRDFLDVELVDQIIHPIATADDPDLGFFGRRNGQQFVELCSHHYFLDNSLLLCRWIKGEPLSFLGYASKVLLSYETLQSGWQRYTMAGGELWLEVSQTLIFIAL